jgi:hypothetical protein
MKSRVSKSKTLINQKISHQPHDNELGTPEPNTKEDIRPKEVSCITNEEKYFRSFTSHTSITVH